MKYHIHVVGLRRVPARVVSHTSRDFGRFCVGFQVLEGIVGLWGGT